MIVVKLNKAYLQFGKVPSSKLAIFVDENIVGRKHLVRMFKKGLEKATMPIVLVPLKCIIQTCLLSRYFKPSINVNPPSYNN